MIDSAIPFEERDRRDALGWIVVATLLVALSILSRVGMIAWPFLNDAGLYAFLGKTVATGGVLYRDFYETKLPGVGLLASLFWRAFGEHWAGYVIGQLVLALIAAGLLARIAYRHVSKTAALPTFLFAVVFLNFAWTVYTGFQLETLQAFFEAVSALAIAEALGSDSASDSLIAGLAAGFAALVKPSGIGIAGAFALALIIQRKNLLRAGLHLATFAFGSIIPVALTILYTIRSGASVYLPTVLRQIERYANATPLGTIWIFKLAVVGGVVVFPMAIAAMLCRKGPRASRSLSNPMIAFAAAWFLVDLAGIILQRRMYPYHFLPLACPAALLYGMLPWRPRPIPVAIGLLPIALLSFKWEGTNLSQIGRGFQREQLSQYISAHTAPGDSVYADQIGRLLIETNREAGSRYGTFFYFVNYDSAPQEYLHGMLEDFDARQPKYILLNSARDRIHHEMADGTILSMCPARRENFLNAWPNFEIYLNTHYSLETKINGTDIYRRRSPQSAVANIRD